jgi:hypothetical protein
MHVSMYLYSNMYVTCVYILFLTHYDTADMRKSSSADPDRKYMQPRGGPPMKREELDD